MCCKALIPPSPPSHPPDGTLMRLFTSRLFRRTCRRFGFPDVVLWRPKSDKGVAESRSGGGSSSGDEKGLDWGAKTHFGLGWDGYGEGWEVRLIASIFWNFQQADFVSVRLRSRAGTMRRGREDKHS